MATENHKATSPELNQPFRTEVQARAEQLADVLAAEKEHARGAIEKALFTLTGRLETVAARLDSYGGHCRWIAEMLEGDDDADLVRTFHTLGNCIAPLGDEIDAVVQELTRLYRPEAGGAS